MSEWTVSRVLVLKIKSWTEHVLSDSLLLNSGTISGSSYFSRVSSEWTSGLWQKTQKNLQVLSLPIPELSTEFPVFLLMYHTSSTLPKARNLVFLSLLWALLSAFLQSKIKVV